MCSTSSDAGYNKRYKRWVCLLFRSRLGLVLHVGPCQAKPFPPSLLKVLPSCPMSKSIGHVENINCCLIVYYQKCAIYIDRFRIKFTITSFYFQMPLYNYNFLRNDINIKKYVNYSFLIVQYERRRLVQNFKGCGLLPPLRREFDIS